MLLASFEILSDLNNCSSPESAALEGIFNAGGEQLGIQNFFAIETRPTRQVMQKTKPKNEKSCSKEETKLETKMREQHTKTSREENGQAKRRAASANAGRPIDIHDETVI